LLLDLAAGPDDRASGVRRFVPAALSGESDPESQPIEAASFVETSDDFIP
jgi:hypothetical protein